MGKGNRNRDLRVLDKIDHPEKYKEKKHAPKWLSPVISIVVLVAILFGVAYSVIVNNGIIERSRVLVKSQTGKYDITQPMAAFLAWESAYYTYAQYYSYYASYDSSISSTYSSAEIFALNQAYNATVNNLHESISNMSSSLVNYVAVCDAAYQAGVTLTDEEIADAEKIMDDMETIRQTFVDEYSNDLAMKDFIQTVITPGLKKSDILAAAKLVALYSKYYTQIQDGFDKAATEEDIYGYAVGNPSEVYKTSYLYYTAEDETFAQELVGDGVTDSASFLTKVFEKLAPDYLDTAYQTLGTKAKVQLLVQNINGKTGTDLTNVLTSNGFSSTAFTRDTVSDVTEIKSWFFDILTREEGDASLIETDDAYYLVVFVSSTDADNKTGVVNKYEKKKLADADSTLSTDLLAHLKSDAIEKPETAYEPDATKYKRAAARATALKGTVTVANYATELANYQMSDELVLTPTSTTADAPQAIITTALAQTETGVVVVSDEGTEYILVVKEIPEDDPETADVDESENRKIVYALITDDLYYQIYDEVQTDVINVIPTEQVLTSSDSIPTDTEDNFQAWLLEGEADASNHNLLKGKRAANDKKYFREVTTDADTETITYKAYIIVSPMALNEDRAVYGGYASFTSSADADEALASLEGKTGDDLLDAFSALSGASVYSAYTADNLSDTNLSNWMMSTDRKADDLTKLTSADGTYFFLAFVNSLDTVWHRTAKDGWISDQTDAWLKETNEGYYLDEYVLNKIETTATTEATTEATTDSEVLD